MHSLERLLGPAVNSRNQMKLGCLAHRHDIPLKLNITERFVTMAVTALVNVAQTRSFQVMFCYKFPNVIHPCVPMSCNTLSMEFLQVLLDSNPPELSSTVSSPWYDKTIGWLSLCWVFLNYQAIWNVFITSCSFLIVSVRISFDSIIDLFSPTFESQASGNECWCV